MSLTGAMASAISGLNAQSQALAMVSDNLANSTTTGYKTTTGMFDDLVTNAAGASQYSSGGVSVYGRSDITKQGLLTLSTNSTDVAIQGSGFFVVNNSSSGNGVTSYTRDGAFVPDNSGFLVNNGSYLMGYPVDSSGKQTGGSLEPININAAANSAQATTETTFQANLPADAAAGTALNTTMTVYDSLGNPSTVNVTWTRSTPASDNTWTASFGDPASTPPGAVYSAADASTQVGTATGSVTVKFDNNGNLVSPTTPPTMSVAWTDGAAPSTITLNLGTAGKTDGLSQFASNTTPPSISLGNSGIVSDGMPFGKLSSVAVGKNGMLNATYSNGQTIPIFQIPVATFAAPNALLSQSNGLYQVTAGSGGPTVQASGTNGAGAVMGGELESSATDTNAQFSTMMSAQQAYSSSAQVITTVNKMFDTLMSSLR